MSVSLLESQSLSDAAALPLLLTTDEAAAVLRISPKTLRNWVADADRGPRPVKVGSRTLYRRDDVLIFAGLVVAA